MKKSFLILAAGLIAGLANAQEARKSVLFNYGSNRSEVVNKGAAFQLSSTMPTINNNDPKPAVPGGTAGTRWYDYVDEIMAPATATGTPGFSGMNMWENQRAIFGFTGTTPFDTVRFVSAAMGFQPFASAWNSSTMTGMAITAYDAYVIDSVAVCGAYERNPAKPTIVDTLIFTFVTGNGASTADLANGLEYPAGALPSAYGLTTGLPLLTMYYDSLNNRAGGSNGIALIVPPITTVVPITAPTRVYKMLMNVPDTLGFTHTIGELNTVYPRAGHSDPTINVSVPAGNYTSMSISFKSGEAGIPDYATIRNVDQTYNYGCYTPIIGFAADAAGDPVFPPFVLGDWTSGYFKRLYSANSVGTYVPNWGWTTTGTGPSFLQYPFVSFHVSCASCLSIPDSRLAVNNVTEATSVKVYPNPSNEVVNIDFNTGNAANTVVTLSNVLGQVVATQNMGNVAKGKASFNTANLPAGVYMYNVSVNNISNTGRVVVGH